MNLQEFQRNRQFSRSAASISRTPNTNKKMEGVVGKVKHGEHYGRRRADDIRTPSGHDKVQHNSTSRGGTNPCLPFLRCPISSHRGHCSHDSRETGTGTTALKGHKSSTSTGKEGEGGGHFYWSMEWRWRGADLREKMVIGTI